MIISRNATELRNQDPLQTKIAYKKLGLILANAEKVLRHTK